MGRHGTMTGGYPSSSGARAIQATNSICRLRRSILRQRWQRCWEWRTQSWMGDVLTSIAAILIPALANNLADHPEPVAAQYLENVVGPVAALEEACGRILQFVLIVEPLGAHRVTESIARFVIGLTVAR